MTTNGVDVSRFSPYLQGHGASACNKSSCVPVIAHVSNFRPVKRMGDIVRIFAKVLETVDARLLLIGDGPERSHVEASLRDLGIQDKVCLLGALREFSTKLSKSSVFLLPSEYESFGLAALEAMACGVPVVATNIGGIPEVVENNNEGLLYGLGDIDGMASGIVKILMDDDFRSRLAANALHKASSRFSIDSVVDMYSNMYAKLLR